MRISLETYTPRNAGLCGCSKNGGAGCVLLCVCVCGVWFPTSLSSVGLCFLTSSLLFPQNTQDNTSPEGGWMVTDSTTLSWNFPIIRHMKDKVKTHDREDWLVCEGREKYQRPGQVADRQSHLGPHRLWGRACVSQHIISNPSVWTCENSIWCARCSEAVSGTTTHSYVCNWLTGISFDSQTALWGNFHFKDKKAMKQ